MDATSYRKRQLGMVVLAAAIVLLCFNMTHAFAQEAYAYDVGCSPLATQSSAKARISLVTLDGATAYSYTGMPIEPAVTVRGSDGRILGKGVDYTLEYRNSTKAGTASVKVTGIGLYSGSKSLSFKIDKVDMSAATVPASVAAQTFTGKALRPDVKATYKGLKLVSGTDYTLSYSNNTHVGKATITVKGKGNFTGSRTVKFNINKAKHPGLSVFVNKPSARSFSSTAYTVSASPKVVGQKGNLTYSNASSGAAAKFTVDCSTGRIAVPANMAAGKYNVSLKVSDDGGGDYTSSAASATVAIEITGNAANSSFSVAAIQPSNMKYSTGARTLKNNFRVAGKIGNVKYSNVSLHKDLLRFKVNAADGSITVPAKMPVGSYSVACQVVDDGGANYAPVTKNVTIRITIEKALQPMAVSAKGKTLSATSVAKKALTAGNVTVKDAQGKVFYDLSGGGDHFKISKGVATAKKGTPKGTYNLKVKVIAAGNGNYFGGYKTVTLTVKVK